MGKSELKLIGRRQKGRKNASIIVVHATVIMKPIILNKKLI